MDNTEHRKITDFDTSTPKYYEEWIKDWFSKTKFKRKFLGGIDEADVWRKLKELDELYEEALRHERVRYDELLAKSSQCENERLEHEAQ